jgi:hypothetical protein
VESIEEVLHNIAVRVQNLSETQRFVIIGVFAVLGIIWILRKNPKDSYDISGKVGSKRRTGVSIRRRTDGRTEFYTTPGTYDIVEAHPHKFNPREKPNKKSWDEELGDWVKKRKTKRR